ncbi:MAG: type II secretion system GspH family protein [Verrucomicrobiales bacterium]|nr:type II secretion system GspH family protein [Verrucomicrobiales bacterium]
MNLEGNRTAQTRKDEAFTLIELLVVITIIAILSTLMIPATNSVISSARATTASSALRDITNTTINWTVDNGNRLPSPIYSDVDPEDVQELNPLGTGLWCDGAIYNTMYPPDPLSGESMALSPPPSRATAGGHLVDTVFESKASIRLNPQETNWYRHGYGMNKNLVYDEINQSAPDPWLTEKSMANIKFMPSAMIYMDSFESVINSTMVMNGSGEGSILGNAAARYRNKFLLVAFLDGHVVRMHPNEILSLQGRDFTRFWQGVDPDRAK